MDEPTKDLVVEREFNVPVEKVWDAWTKPEELSNWFAPDAWTIPECTMDVRPEGKLSLQMKSPEGVIAPMDAVYKEVSKNNKLTFVSAVPDDKGNPIFKVEHNVLFTDEGEKTKLKMVWKVVFETPEAKPFLAGMSEGLNQSLGHLEQLLAQQ